MTDPMDGRVAQQKEEERAVEAGEFALQYIGPQLQSPLGSELLGWSSRLLACVVSPLFHLPVPAGDNLFRE